MKILPLNIILLWLIIGCHAECAKMGDGILREKASIVSVEVQTITATEKWILSDVRLVTENEDTIQGRIRRPAIEDRSYPLAFLVVGIETGKEVVSMITGYDSIIVFSIDYPYSGEMDFSGWKGLTTILALRTVGFKSVGNIMASLDWLSSLQDVDTTDISIIAVSFGVFTGVPAAVFDRRVDRLAVVQAGGDLQKILATNSERMHASVPAWFAGWLGSQILAPFEPNTYIGSLSPRPFLLVSGESDQLFPAESIQSLYDHARDPKEWIKHRSGHVDPSMRNLIMELAEIVGEKYYP